MYDKARTGKIECQQQQRYHQSSYENHTVLSILGVVFLLCSILHPAIFLLLLLFRLNRLKYSLCHSVAHFLFFPLELRDLKSKEQGTEKEMGDRVCVREKGNDYLVRVAL